MQPLLSVELTVTNSPAYERDLNKTFLYEQISSFFHYSSLFKEKILYTYYKNEDTLLVIITILMSDGKFFFMKSETNSCLKPAPFWRKVTLILFSFNSFPQCCTFLPRLENTLFLVLQALLKTESTRKLTWKPLLLRFWNPRSPQKKLNYWALAGSKSSSFLSHDFVIASVVRWVISECWYMLWKSNS